jgi:hypothetical protein
MSGKHMNRAPYGYLDDPMRKGYWIIDPETAPIVKKIYDLAMEGNGTARIAGILEREQIETPTTVYNRRHGKPLPPHPCHWEDGTTTGILDRPEYYGCTCSFKTYSKSYKLKKRIQNKPEDMYIIENTQDAIIPKEQWDRVQELRKLRHRTPKSAERKGLFSSIIFCADCGRRMHFCSCKSFDSSQDNYRCSLYKSGYGECSAHYIREAVLRDIVLERIRAVTDYVRLDAVGFQEEWMHITREAQEKSIRLDQKQLERAQKRLEDVDKLISKVYEDYALGKLPEERYLKMTADYEKEQDSLRAEISVMSDLIEEKQEENDNYDRFSALINKYVDIPELTGTIVNDFIKKIIVHAPDKSSGKRKQKIEIIFNFVDQVDIPILTESVILEPTPRKKKTA